MAVEVDVKMDIVAGEVGVKMDMQEQMEVLEQRKPAPLHTVNKRDIVRDG